MAVGTVEHLNGLPGQIALIGFGAFLLRNQDFRVIVAVSDGIEGEFVVHVLLLGVLGLLVN